VEAGFVLGINVPCGKKSCEQCERTKRLDNWFHSDYIFGIVKNKFWINVVFGPVKIAISPNFIQFSMFILVFKNERFLAAKKFFRCRLYPFRQCFESG
jgi:glutaredoxin